MDRSFLRFLVGVKPILPAIEGSAKLINRFVKVFWSSHAYVLFHLRLCTSGGL